MLRIASWNVNGIRSASEKGLFAWLQDSRADIICLQETKARPQQLTKQFFEIQGFEPTWASAQKPGYSGVAIYTRLQPLSVRLLGIDEFDNEGRVLVHEYNDFTLFNCYFPNSQEAGARLPYKLAFCNALKEQADKIVAQGKHVVICGDYNIAHKSIDLEHPKANEANPGYLPEERAWMDGFTEQGYIDSFRHFNTEAKQYSWWSYRMRARERNIGWRLDYVCTNQAMLPLYQSAAIHQSVHGSDHCPVSLDLDLKGM